MENKPLTAAEYSTHPLDKIRATCLYLATILGDFQDDLILIGGLVPALLIDQAALPTGVEMHPGTRDLDIGLSLTIINEDRYDALEERLRRNGFQPALNKNNNPSLFTWNIQGVTVDFLIPPTTEWDGSSRMQHLTGELAAVITPGLNLAFDDKRKICLSGRTIKNEQVEREIWVCGPAAFIILKALAFAVRGEPKDAFDLFYVARNCPDGIEAIADKLNSFRPDPSALKALQTLRKDFTRHDHIGPSRIADFLAQSPGDEIRADVVSFFQLLLKRCDPC